MAGHWSVAWEAGEKPARTRHCDRGSPPHARKRRPLARHSEPGRRGGIGPEARRPAPTASPHRPSWKGVGHHATHPFPAARSRARARACARRHSAAHSRSSRGTKPGKRRPKGPTPNITVRVEGLTKTLLAADRRHALRASVTKNGKAPTAAAAAARRRAPGRHERRAWRGTWSRPTASTSSPRSRASGLPEQRRQEYWAFWVNDAPAQPRASARYDPKPGDEPPVLPRLLRQELCPRTPACSA
jgi:hypothetical protein